MQCHQIFDQALCHITGVFVNWFLLLRRTLLLGQNYFCYNLLHKKHLFRPRANLGKAVFVWLQMDFHPFNRKIIIFFLNFIFSTKEKNHEMTNEYISIMDALSQHKRHVLLL